MNYNVNQGPLPVSKFSYHTDCQSNESGEWTNRQHLLVDEELRKSPNGGQNLSI